MSALLHQQISTLDMIAQALTRDTDRLVVIGAGGEHVTAQGLADEISRYQQSFEALEPRPRRAALLSRNRIEVLYASNGLNFAGVVNTALHPMGSVDDYLYVIEDAGIDTLLFDPDHYADIAAQLKARAPGLLHLLALGQTDVGTDLAEKARSLAPRPLVAPPCDPDALFRIAYSGGTTGKPKGIMTTHRAAATSTLIQLTSWEWPKEVRHLICAPLSHSGAAVLSAVLVKGGSMVVLPGFDPVGTMQAIADHRITSVLMVPTMVLAMIDHPRFGEFDLSSLEVIFYGASAFPTARLKEAIGKLGPIFFQFYGQAEAPMSVTLLRRDEHDVDDMTRLSSCGRPSPLVRVALLDDACNEVPEGEPGEICVRGPLLMAGYLNKPEETAAAFEGGWLHTGDVAVRSPDGFLRIVDRKKDMIVTGGFNVYAREVEDVLVEHPGVRQAAVIGVPDEKWGEAVKAVVVLEPGVEVDPQALIARVREKKGAVQAPKTVEFVDELPLSPLGKPDKKALRVRYAAVTAPA
ncbi:acyl-CoA synthetase [Novosphingobium barchaimii LL02]|uniref:Acyl-CoA synthetase n=1 Tax=Novosphingobium barchaimii LL02 TaxID=1114963 RepID=A0A0J7XIY8_9SPHN|nr:AMP-binding protein [Novosphingobium barchaimii]KMS51991.1 acyl-CoA synthetase [Novosphingobium barchaimii LL02]